MMHNVQHRYCNQYSGYQKEQQSRLFEPSDGGNGKNQHDADKADTPGSNVDAGRKRP